MVDTPAILIATQFVAKGCADTVAALELAASPAASQKPSVSSVDSAPRRKVVRQGPCIMGCTVSAHHVNGVMTWRCVPSDCQLFPPNASICEAHYKQSLSARRKRKKDMRTAPTQQQGISGVAVHGTTLQGNIAEGNDIQGSQCSASQFNSSNRPVCSLDTQVEDVALGGHDQLSVTSRRVRRRVASNDAPT